ncbi:hypothetical protein O9992_17305 [Vibrio lentus]|nr:hypothetical protein [Vibrio lentus]
MPIMMLNIMRNYSLAIGFVLPALLILIYQTMAHQGLVRRATFDPTTSLSDAIVLLGMVCCGRNGEARSIIKH